MSPREDGLSNSIIGNNNYVYPIVSQMVKKIIQGGISDRVDDQGSSGPGGCPIGGQASCRMTHVHDGTVTERPWTRFLCTIQQIGVMVLVGWATTAGAAGIPVPGQVLLKWRPEVTEEVGQALLRSMQARQVDGIAALGVRILKVPEERQAKVVEALARHPHVQFVESDMEVAPDALPNDPNYSKQWHLPKIQGPSAWDHTVGDASVIIAILDTGVDPAHPDLAQLLVPGWNVYDNNSDTRDVYGHGTSVAGSASAMGNNGLGIASVTWRSRIMPIRISSTTGGATFSAMAKGLTYAADNGARVANISYNSAARSATVQSAAKYLHDRGGVVTISSGNDSQYIEAADNAYVLAVGATTSSDGLASFSNRGQFVDLVAPGSSIYTTANGGGYRSVSGTSFSAPITAGVAALVFSVNPGLSGGQVQDVLKQTADDLGGAGYDTSYGHGRVNAYRAVLAALSAVPPVAPDTTAPEVRFVTPGQGSFVEGTQMVRVEATDDTGVDSMALYLGSDLVAVGGGGILEVAWDTTTHSDGNVTLTALAWDLTGNEGTAQVTVSVANLPDQTAPTVGITSPGNGAKLNKSQKIAVSATDDTAVTQVELYANGAKIGSVAGTTSGTYSFTWNTTKVAKGTYLLEAVAYDAAGNSSVSIGVSVFK